MNLKLNFIQQESLVTENVFTHNIIYEIILNDLDAMITKKHNTDTIGGHYVN